MLTRLNRSGLLLFVAVLLLVGADASAAFGQVTINPQCQLKKNVMPPPMPATYDIKGLGSITNLPACGYTITTNFQKVTGGFVNPYGTQHMITGSTTGGTVSFDTGWDPMNPAPAELLQLLTIAALQPTSTGHRYQRVHIATLAGAKRKSRLA